MLKQVFGGLSNAANHILNQVSAEVSKMPMDRGQSHYEPVDPFFGLTDEERRHIQLVQKRAEEEAQMLNQLQKPTAAEVSRGNLSPEVPSSNLLEAESNEDEGELSSEVSTVKLVDTAGGEVSEAEQESFNSDSSSETGGADEVSDEPSSSDVCEVDNRTEINLQGDHIEKEFNLTGDEKNEIAEAAIKTEERMEMSCFAASVPITEEQMHKPYVEELDAASATAQETSEAVPKVHLEKQPTIVVHSPSSSSRESYDDDSFGDTEAHFLPDYDELEHVVCDVNLSTEENESALVTFPSVPLEVQNKEIHELQAKVFDVKVGRRRAESFCENPAKDRVLKELNDSRRRSLPAWCTLAYEDGERSEQMTEDRKEAFTGFEYDESAIPSTYTDGMDISGQQPSDAVIHDEVEQNDLGLSRLRTENETSHEQRENADAHSLVVYEPNPFSNYLTESHDEVTPATNTEADRSVEKNLTQTMVSEEPLKTMDKPLATYAEGSDTAMDVGPDGALKSRSDSAGLVKSNISSLPSSRVEPANIFTNAPTKGSAVHRTEAPIRQYPTAAPRSGGSSFKVSFGNLFSKTKSDLTSLASTVKSHTEAALKRASDTVASSLSSSVSATSDLYATSMEPANVPRRSASAMATLSDDLGDEDRWSTANSQKMPSFTDSTQEPKAESTDFEGIQKKKFETRSGPILPASLAQSGRISYGSDSTEDTGYSSRCSPEDEFYRIGSDGMQYFVTYSTPHTATIDQIKGDSAYDHYAKQKQEGSAGNQFEEKFAGGKEVQLAKVLSSAQQQDNTLSQSARKPYGEIPSNAIAVEPTDLVTAGQVVCDEALSSADQTCPQAQMYDSSEVSSEMYDEEEQNRIKEIESEFIFDPDKIDTTPVGEWQICPLCQMTEIHMRSDGVSLTGQQCASCRFTVCFKCGQVHEINGAVSQKCYDYLMILCFEEITTSKISPRDGQQQVELVESGDESGQSDDSGDDDDSYPDVVIEVPSSPVKFEAEEETHFSSQHAQECFQVIREIEERFPANLDDYETSFSDKVSCREELSEPTLGSTERPAVTFPSNSVAGSDTTPLSLEHSLSGSATTSLSSSAADVSASKSEQPKRQLSIGEEIFGQLPDTPSEEESTDYEQAMRYYSAQPFYGHRPGPVYTIVEENEENNEIPDSRPKISSGAAKPTSVDVRSDKLATEGADKLTSPAVAPTQKKPSETVRAHETILSGDASRIVSAQSDVQPNGSSPKPIRAAPPPPFSQGLNNVRDMEKSVTRTATAVDVFNAQAYVQKTSNPPNLGNPRLESSYCTCAHSDRNAEEKHDIDPEAAWTAEGATHRSITRSTYLTSFGRLSAEGGANGMDLVDMTSSQPSGDWWTDETGTSIDGGSDKLSAGIDERLAHVWQKTTNAYFKDAGVLSEHPERGVFVSRLKRSPAMILSGIKDESDSSTAEVAPSISSSADAFKTTLSKGVLSSSQSDSWASTKKYLNDQLSLSQSVSGDMGRRKLPSVPPTFGRCQFVPADQPQASWQYNKQLISTPGGSKGSSSGKYGELVDRTTQPKLSAVGKRALPPTLARVLLKQELKEVLLKRMERLEASEIEANQREFVVTRYLTTGIYPKSVGIDSAPRVVQCGLPLEMVKGCIVKLDERKTPTYDKFHADTERAEKSELQRHKEILNRIVEIERMTKQACERMDISVGTSDPLKEATRINSTTQTYSQSVLKDAQTQTLLETDVSAEKKLTQIEPLSVGADSQWKSVAVGTSDAEVYKIAATDTQGLESTSARFPENVPFSGSRKFRDLHSKAFALFSAEDDSASREYRKSRIRREIARRRENFNSCEDLTFSMREPYFDEMGLRRQSFLGPYRSSGPYTSSLPHYSSLPRIDLLYDSPPRNQTYYDRMPERSFFYPYSGPVQRLPRKLEGYPQSSDYMLDDDRGSALANEPARRSYLSLSLPYLDSVHNVGLTREPSSYSHSWRDDLMRSTQPSGRSLLSHYANYLNNDFLSRPSAVNDYYRSADSPIDYSLSQPYFMKSNADQLPSDTYAPGQASLSTTANTVCGHLPSRYDRYMEPIESVPPSSLCPSSDFDRKLPWQTPAPSLFDPELMEAEFNPEVSRPKSGGSLVEPYFRQGPVAQRPNYSDFHGEFEGRYGYKTSRSLMEPSAFSVMSLNCSPTGHGIGMRVIGGKILPGSDSELVTYVAAVYKGGLVDLMGEVKEGDQILEWNGIQLNGKTYEEVQKVIDSTEGEVEILIKSGANLNQVYHLEDGQSTSLDKGYESDYVGATVKRGDVKLVSQNGTLEKRSDIDGGKASPCFSTTPRTQSPQAQQQTTQSSGSLQARVYFESSTGTLFVTIVCAKELSRLEKRRRPPNPFVKVYLLPKRRVENKRRTKFLPKTTHPEWNQTVAYKDLTIETLSGKALEFTVWSYERFRENIFLGRAVVQLSEALYFGPKLLWYQLCSTL
ncbi:hypothetical protein M514_04273 [Trichuris suis]|uniref:Uncharacterized protein n=1 Tax=Trichuris suis TaxID=68888 RepID=A0A085NQG4_9BILA|nr:hypothetical protein M514_04273 [Trichuris suis]